MSTFQQHLIDVDGVRTAVRTGGDASSEPILLLHGGVPGISPYCGGSHLWGSTLDPLASKYLVVMPDMLASGATAIGDGPLTVEQMASHAMAVSKAAGGSGAVHIVGHDIGGLVGLWCAIESPERIASLTIVASTAAAPTGDGISNLTLLSPPAPAWSRAAQAWAFDRLSYSHLHIDDVLLNAASKAAFGAAHREIELRIQQNDALVRELATSQSRVKFQFFKAAREGRIRVPVQVVCGSHDPLVSVEQNVWLFRAIAAHQPATHLRVINRAGNFPFREQPDQFRAVIDSFVTGVCADSRLELSK